jgi:hypothetical protein
VNYIKLSLESVYQLIPYIDQPTVLVDTSRQLPSDHHPSTLFPTRHNKKGYSTSSNTSTATNTTTGGGFGACLLSKDDNDNLREWIAYHFTILPLRHVLVGVDDGSVDDPKDVLTRWEHAGIHELTFKVVNVSDFVNIHSKFNRQKVGENATTDEHFRYAHHLLKHKQQAFITYCTRHMLLEDVTWVSMWDTDEYLVVNRIGQDERDKNAKKEKSQTSGDDDEQRYGVKRSVLPDMESNDTVADMMQSMIQQSNITLKACHVVPRVTIGAMETYKCPESVQVNAMATDRYRLNTMELNTIRFHQHAKKDDFPNNKWGKVMMNIRTIPNGTFDNKLPSNIHRPYKSECPQPSKNVWTSPFVLMHHVGSWERYGSRGDARRSYETWSKRAFLNASISFCHQQVHRWLPRFIDDVGPERARYLLSSDN